MALDEDDEEENEEEESESGGGGKLKLIILIVVVVLLLAGIGVGAWLFLSSGDEPVEGEAGEVAEEQAAEEPAEPAGPPVYVKIHPAFTVNFTEESTATFLQVEVQVMTRDAAVEEDLKTHMPRIKNDLLLLFREKQYDEVNTSAGQRKLSLEALATIQKTLEDSGANSAVEAVYFTSFVMQ